MVVTSLFVTLNNLVHDFASAMWVASIVIVYVLGRKSQSVPREVSLILLDLAKLFRIVLVGSIMVIFLTGVGRTIAYNYFTQQTSIHTYAVLGKHVILLLAATISVVYVWKVIGKWQSEAGVAHSSRDAVETISIGKTYS